jgi:cell division transport system permease protein
MGIHTKTAIENIKRSPFQAISAIFVFLLTFFVATTVAVLVLALNNSLKYLETRPQIIAFLKNDADENAVSSLMLKLQSDSRLKDLKYVPKEEALKIYKEATSDNPLLSELVSPSVFPASIEFSVTDLNLTQNIITEVSSETVVDQVGFTANIGGEKTLNNVLERLKTISNYIRIGGLSFVAILGITSFLILTVIISMRLTARKGEIEILSLIGATNSFVKKPIMLESVIYVLTGVIFGWFGSLIMWLYITPSIFSYFGNIEVLPKDPFMFFLMFATVLGIEFVFGLILAFLGTHIAVSRSLKRLK